MKIPLPKKPRLFAGLLCLIVAALLFLLNCFHLKLENFSIQLQNFITAVCFVTGAILCLSSVRFGNYIFDPLSYQPNKTPENLVKSLRLRALLFNNVSVVIVFFIILIIIIGFIFLINPPIENSGTGVDNTTSLTVRIGSSVLLIFLVQILFRVFKYLLRVAAFYNAKADALEYSIITSHKELEKIMPLFTPDQYDMSDVPSPAFFDSLKK
ncbi:MAG: hypothetical protein ACXVP0_09715 [Bacteroidia bacterium]